MAKKSSYNNILQSIGKREFAPVYLLMGEEAYFIDRIADAIDRTVLTEDEKSFNQMTIYCTADTDVGNIINLAKRYPMMAEHQVVFVKEMQNLKDAENIVAYLQNPLATTILVLCYKHGKVDKRKKLVSVADKIGVVYESEKLREYELPEFIETYLKETNTDGRNITIAKDAAEVLASFVGADLSRMAGEIDKLRITMPAGENIITTGLIEKNIGISKEFNQWELRNALVSKNVFKANQIMAYFNDNPKPNPPVMTVAVLFSFFAGLMQAYYAPEKSPHGIMNYLGLKTPYQVQDYLTAMGNYSARKVFDIIAKLRETDAKLKGVGKGNTSDSDIMKELLFFILH